MLRRTTVVLVALTAVLPAAGCGGSSHYTLAGVQDCLRQNGATGVSARTPDYEGDPDAAVIGDWMGFLGQVTGTVDGHSFSISVTDTSAYASPSTPGQATAIEPIQPCVTAIDASGG